MLSSLEEVEHLGGDAAERVGVGAEERERLREGLGRALAAIARDPRSGARNAAERSHCRTCGVSLSDPFRELL